MKALWIIVLAGMSLGACASSYRPLYESYQISSERPVVVGTVRMQDMVHDFGQRRAAQRVAQRLREVFPAEDGAYRVDVQIEEYRSTLAIQRDATDQRYSLSLRGHVRLFDNEGTEHIKTTISSMATYNVEDTPFSTEAGRRNAQLVAAESLADEVIGTIFHFLKTQEPDADS